MSTTSINLDYSLLLVSDIDWPNVNLPAQTPTETPAGLYASNDSCLVISTFHSDEGDTTLHWLLKEDTTPPRAPEIDLRIQSPSQFIAARDVNGNMISPRTPLCGIAARIRVWVDIPFEPKEIWVLVTDG